MTPSRASGHFPVGVRFDPREASAATREHRARAFSSPSSMLSTAFAILALARVVDAAVVPEWPGDLTPQPGEWGAVSGVSAQKAAGGGAYPFLVWNVYDDDIVGGKSFSDPSTWKMYYSGVAKGPWVQLDLGAEWTISAIEIYGHRADTRCDLNLLESFSAGCDGSVQQLGEDYYPTFSVEEYANLNDGGAVIGVGPPGEIGPCTDGENSGGNCGGVVCATLSTMLDVGFADLGEDGIEKSQDASIKVICDEKPVGQYVYVYLPGPNRELFLGEIRVAYADAGTPAGITCDASTSPANAKSGAEGLGDCSASLAAGASCTPVCKDGYTAVAAECSMTGDLTAARCDGVQITCPASDDGAPLNVLQTESAETCVKTLNAGETCTPDCADGFRPVDAVCGAEGALTAVADCDQITCDASTSPANAKSGAEGLGDCSASLAAGASCTPVCQDGYTAVAAQCSASGDLTAAECTPPSAPPTADPANATQGEPRNQTSPPSASPPPSALPPPFAPPSPPRVIVADEDSSATRLAVRVARVVVAAAAVVAL